MNKVFGKNIVKYSENDKIERGKELEKWLDIFLFLYNHN